MTSVNSNKRASFRPVALAMMAVALGWLGLSAPVAAQSSYTLTNVSSNPDDVGALEVILCDGKDFTGTCNRLTLSGNIRRADGVWEAKYDKDLFGLKFIRVQSFKIGEGVTLTLCNRRNQTGTCLTYDRGVTSLKDRTGASISGEYMKRGRTQSIVIESKNSDLSQNNPYKIAAVPAGRVRICLDANYSVGCQVLAPGTYDFPGGEIYRSISFGEGVTAQTYLEPNFRGPSQYVTTNRGRFNIVSIRVLGQGETLVRDIPSSVEQARIEERKEQQLAVVADSVQLRDGDSALALKKGDHSLNSQVFRNITVGSNVQAQIYSDTSFAGPSRIIGPGQTASSVSIRSIRVTEPGTQAVPDIVSRAEQRDATRLETEKRLAAEEAARENERLAVLAREEAAALEAERLEQFKAEEKAALLKLRLPVVLPQNNSGISLVDFGPVPLRSISEFTAYRERGPGPRPSGPRAPMSDSVRKYLASLKKLDLVLKEDNSIHFSEEQPRDQFLRPENEFNAVPMPGGLRLKKITPFNKSFTDKGYFYGLKTDGGLTRLEFDAKNRTLSQRSLPGAAFGFVDLYLVRGKNRLYGLQQDGTLFVWNLDSSSAPKRIKTQLTSITVDASTIYGINKNAELISMNEDGTEPNVLRANVSDFAIDPNQGRLFLIASDSAHLFSARLSATSLEREVQLDPEATFTGFLSKDSCQVVNGSGQYFTCD